MFFNYSQNNSGGFFHKDMGYHFIVEAESNLQADAIAQDHGVYFNGCDKNIDCPCCGDRWHPADEGTSTPVVYDKEVKLTIKECFGFKAGKQIKIIRSGGIVEWL